MQKSRNYWAVFQGREVLFEGSFSDCWTQLTEQFGKQTVSSLVKNGIRIGRLS
ncbi:hypothetical protein [Fimbriiglobus ruber]|uniref:Uncharacterized protein n=1 Tax=Fimbriiglobus ruber TaxID=1908690 RepID=A0A225DDG6_9BACT|nr:hypothetical protein [Fimbriiglobus ruber]OWK39512.1 hypothetical protein FRUB_06075 [Fimbriiglobus ruber]